MSEDLILEERALARVSKDEATPDAASWFETRGVAALLTMRIGRL
jgi:hypothetical protein